MGGIGKILEKQSSFALYLYSEAINSQFYEHLLMITAGINDSLELLDGWPEPTMESKKFWKLDLALDFEGFFDAVLQTSFFIHYFSISYL